MGREVGGGEKRMREMGERKGGLIKTNLDRKQDIINVYSGTSHNRTSHEWTISL